ncbi:MAG: hypothetical protein ACXVCH_18020, partial [Bdellovibrionota bacterium]
MLRVIALAILLWGSVPMESLARAETSSPLLKIFPAEGFSKIVTGSSSTEDLCPKPADCYAPKPGDVVETGTPLTPVLSRTFLLEILRAYQSEARAYAARLEAAQGDHDSPLVASLEAKLHLLSESELLLQRLKGKPESSVAKLRAQEQKLLAQEPILLHRDIQEWIRKRSTKKLPWKSILADQLKASSHFSDLLEKSIARVEMGCVSTQEVCASENLGAPPIGDTEFFEIVRHVLYWPQWSPRLAPGTKEAI